MACVPLGAPNCGAGLHIRFDLHGWDLLAAPNRGAGLHIRFDLHDCVLSLSLSYPKARCPISRLS